MNVFVFFDNKQYLNVFGARTLFLKPTNGTDECVKMGSGPCNPDWRAHIRDVVEEEAVDVYLLLFSAIFMSEILFLIVMKKNVSSEKFKISVTTIPLLLIIEALVAALLIPSDALFNDAASFTWPDDMEGFLARLGRLLSAGYIQLSSVSLLCMRKEDEQIR